MELSNFDYSLPKEFIAQVPLLERHSSRMMLVYKSKGQIIDSAFMYLPQHLRKGDLLVINNTKVIQARLFAHHPKRSRRIEILLTKRLQDNCWETLVKKAHYVRKGDILIIQGDRVKANVIEEMGEGKRILKFHFKGDFLALLKRIGKVPLPPYIKREEIKDLDQERYQTIFASKPGSVAAPTGGLHFSSLIIDKIKKAGIELVDITLHIGPGTFRPIRINRIEKHRMEEEYYQIPQSSAEKIIVARNEGRRIIAIGTSTTRALETWAMKGMNEKNNLKGWTDLFIYPGFRFRIIKGLLTNFHFPRSTLLLLVSAFAGWELILKAYQHAIKKKYRFYSYGDSMLIL